VTLPASTAQAGHAIKATFRRLKFKAKVKMTPAEREREAARRKKLGMGGRRPVYQKVHYWMRAAVILDTERRQMDAQRRRKRIAAYESELRWTLEHLNTGRYYGDPEWVAGHLADLAHQFKDVRTFVRVDFAIQDGTMSLRYERRPDRIAEAAQLDSRWVLVTNQRRKPGQSRPDYLDWMWCVYKNHRHVERRMRNLKSDLPIRPLYLHRDDAIVALCFVSVVALMVYTLIERDCGWCPT
jgi:transposase